MDTAITIKTTGQVVILVIFNTKKPLTGDMQLWILVNLQLRHHKDNKEDDNDLKFSFQSKEKHLNR